MKKVLWDLLNSVPDYQEFLTLAEMDASSRALAAEYPDVVELFELGKSTEGRTILGLKIGEGSKNALIFGCPHPNEPIGTMMLEHFTRALAENEELRQTLDYTFYVVKCWDADGFVRNEGWLKGPYTITNYSRHFYRPVSYKQVDWTFPIDYKDYHFHDVISETQGMKDLIDRIQPTFTYALHNAGFGGTFFYVTEDVPAIYESLYDATYRQSIPLHLGEPEAPEIPVLAPAVLLAEGIDKSYDFLEKFGAEDICSILQSGTCSDDYSRRNYGTFTFLTELPYFYDPRIGDQSDSDRIRGDVIIEQLDWNKESRAFLRELVTAAEPYVDPDDVYLLNLKEALIEGVDDAERKMAAEDPEYRRLATKAECFDTLEVMKFYSLLSLGMLVRMHEDALKKDDLPAEGRKILAAGLARAKAAWQELAYKLEAKMDYEVIPIRTLVNIQLEAGLKAMTYIHDR